MVESLLAFAICVIFGLLCWIADLLHCRKVCRKHIAGVERMVQFWRDDAIQKDKAGREIWFQLIDARIRLREATNKEGKGATNG